MINIAVLSRDHEYYTKRIQSFIDQEFEDQVCIISACEDPLQIEHENIDVLLGNPNLCAQIVSRCTKLQWLQSTWAGNAPLVNQANKRFIITGLKDVFGQQMCEYLFAYMLYFYRNIGHFIEQQHEHIWRIPEYQSIAGQTLGIMGLGNIGQAVAKQAKALNMRVVSLNLQSRPEIADTCYVLDEINEFAAQCDVIFCLLPDTQQTQGICDERFFNSLKSNCIFINAGRGSVLANDADIINCLQQGRMRAAVLDVFKQEPLPKAHPFWQVDNLLITYHTAAISNHNSILGVFTNNLSRFMQGQPLQYAISMDKGY